LIKPAQNATKQDALLITDIQNDFLPGGTLPVENGDEIIPVINNYIARFEHAHAHIFVSRDWHPPNHTSFVTNGGLWPPHCIQNTEGAKFSPNLKLPDHIVIISKATNPPHEAYSAFEHTNLGDELKKLGIKRLFVAGLATDYCVVETVLDACKSGFETVVLSDATLGINAKPGDVNRALTAMAQNGATQVTEADFMKSEDALPIEEASTDVFAEKPSMLHDAKKKARMRSRGVRRQIKTKHLG